MPTEHFSIQLLVLMWQVWILVSRKMQKYGYKVTGDQCATKWKSLKRKYKEVDIRNRKSGNGRHIWEFFEVQHEQWELSLHFYVIDLQLITCSWTVFELPGIGLRGFNTPSSFFNPPCYLSKSHPGGSGQTLPQQVTMFTVYRCYA